MTKPDPEPAARLRQPTLRQLKGFQAVAQHGSFSRAAEALALTQPALSATIRDLERLLDVTLLERSTHHVALTAAGAALQPQVAWLLNSFSLGVSDMHRALTSQASSLRLAALPSTMHLLAPPLAQWQRLHPEVTLTVRDPLNDALIAALHTGEVDIALGTELDLPAGITAIPVATDELVAVLPRGHRLARSEPDSTLRWRDLQGERLALFASGSTYDLALATLRQQGVALEEADRLLYSESLYSLVRSGLAVGVIARLYTHGVPRQGLVVRPLGAPAITRRIALMVRGPAELHRPAVADCLAYLTQALRTPAKPTRVRHSSPR
ncbi:LysR family transcriptional regulator [Polaromonas sp. SM01]|uniref:LysR family transcriptional regulator n=1 Tax=Polaromonas sp. SM01 TaxID=3085630 RepID=UPI002980E10E|nr:LysR family transcriptional regulator [Polaromonas sp. SM01]MDW5442932.1 LysR family transcriptional regulator [Polaromonas sp. SM01]